MVDLSSGVDGCVAAAAAASHQHLLAEIQHLTDTNQNCTAGAGLKLMRHSVNARTGTGAMIVSSSAYSSARWSTHTERCLHEAVHACVAPILPGLAADHDHCNMLFRAVATQPVFIADDDDVWESPRNPQWYPGHEDGMT